MELTRAQEQRIAQLEECFNAETNQKLDAIIGMLSRLLSNQQSDDQFTLNRSPIPSVKAKGSGSDHLDRSGNDRRVGEIREGSVHKTILKENSTPQFQVPMANSEIVRSIEPGKVDLGLENEDYVVLNENLEQEWDQMNVNEKLEVDGDVERGQKMISDTETSCAHKVLVKMPSKEKCLKHLKAWKFKFKPTSKRSKLKDDRFSFVEETSWFKKNPKETIWDCFKKEFKESMAACGKNGGGSLLECIDEESFGDDRSREVIAELNSYTGLTHLDKSDFRRFDGDKIKEWLFKVEEFFSIDLTHMELKERFENVFEDSIAELKQLQETKEVEDEIEPLTDKEMLVMLQISINAISGFSDHNNQRMKGTHDEGSLFILIDSDSIHNFIYPKVAEKLGCESKSAGLTRVSVADGNKLGVLWLKKVEPITWEVKKLEMRFMTSKQKVLLHGMKPGSGGEIRTQKLNRVQDDEVQISMLCVQESPRESEAAVFFLDCNSLVTTTSLEVGLETKKKLCYKTWMFKYKVDEGILQSRTENSLSRREISTFIYQTEALLFESKEPAVSATQESAIFQSAKAHGMITRGKDGIVKTNLRYSLLAVQRIWEKETHDVDITDAYYVLQEEFEQVENHTPCSVVKLDRPQDHEALLLTFPGDERFQIKHKWRFKLLLPILELELYLDSLVLITSYAHQFDIISLIILMRVELSVFSSTKPDGFFFSTNLEVKVSLKGEDVIQVKRRKKNGTCGT